MLLKKKITTKPAYRKEGDVKFLLCAVKSGLGNIEELLLSIGVLESDIRLLLMIGRWLELSKPCSKELG